MSVNAPLQTNGSGKIVAPIATTKSTEFTKDNVHSYRIDGIPPER